jgi:hypothetical protein
MDGHSRFDYADRVIIDGDDSLVGRVTGFFFRGPVTLIEVSWIHNGDARFQNIEEWRLEKKE